MNNDKNKILLHAAAVKALDAAPWDFAMERCAVSRIAYIVNQELHDGERMLRDAIARLSDPKFDVYRVVEDIERYTGAVCGFEPRLG